MRRDAADRLLPLVDDNEWFFDTELLVLAERHGLRIHEVPVDWVDDPDSRVAIASHRHRGPEGHLAPPPLVRRPGGAGPAADRSTDRLDAAELARFAGVGVVSTVAYALLFLLLRPSLGVLAANAAALAACTVANTAAHGRITFGAEQPVGLRVQLVGGVPCCSPPRPCSPPPPWPGPGRRRHRRRARGGGDRGRARPWPPWSASPS